jgi:hypothetical protein
MATVSYKKVRDYIQQHGEICSSCLKKQNDLHEFYEKKRERFMQAFDRLLQKAETEFSKEVQRLAGEKEDSGT